MGLLKKSLIYGLNKMIINDYKIYAQLLQIRQHI